MSADLATVHEDHLRSKEQEPASEKGDVDVDDPGVGEVSFRVLLNVVVGEAGQDCQPHSNEHRNEERPVPFGRLPSGVYWHGRCRLHRQVSGCFRSLSHQDSRLRFE